AEPGPKDEQDWILYFFRGPYLIMSKCQPSLGSQSSLTLTTNLLLAREHLPVIYGGTVNHW
ncbi:MAG: hypothetical protein GY703_22645, partial [Gammaproteobacteria bacterium]|nr:hypothetical protein [Gammaproteobacteria bacterium]